MNLIIETDLGRDPDDLFAILYLIAAGVNIRCLTITPGGPDQVAVAKLIRDVTKVNFTIGVSQWGRSKTDSGGIHTRLLDRYGRDYYSSADEEGHYLMALAAHEYDDCELLVIGPPTSIGRFLARYPDDFNLSLSLIKRATIQGGFLGYDAHQFPCPQLAKFVGKSSVQTFNLNGDIKGAQAISDSGIPHIQYVCKNVCHTVEFDPTRLEDFKFDMENPAQRLFKEAADLYFDKHDSKKFHDPTAAVCHLHPEIADWVTGKMVREHGGWGGVPSEVGHQIIANINQEALWGHLQEFR